MMRPRSLAAAVACATATTAMAVSVAPASALETKISNGTCTITLSSDEANDWDRVTGAANDIDEKDTLPFSVKVNKANGELKDLEGKLKDLDYKKVDEEAKISTGTVSGDAARRAQANVDAINVISDLSGKYKSALKACADSKTYNSEKEANPGTKKDNQDNTSSNMSDEMKTTLFSLLGVAGVTVVLKLVGDAIKAGVIKLPF